MQLISMLLAYTGYPDLYFCMSLEWCMSCSDGLACVPTDRPRYANEQNTELINICQRLVQVYILP